jgi:branched-chain amino acid transport system substrate-binding protein
MEEKPMSKRMQYVLSALVAVSLILAACGGGGAAQGGGTIKIVSDLPMTGSSLGQTQTIVNAITQAFEANNNQVCNGRYTIEYQAFDDASAALGKWDPDVVTQNAKNYAADKSIVAVIGTFNSGAAQLMIPILNPENLVMISPANTYPGLTKPGKGEADEPDKYYPNGTRNYSRVVPADDLQGAVAAQWAKDLGAASVYILDDQELYGKGIADVFDATANEIGLTVTGHEGIDGKAADYKALATKIKDLAPDLIYFGGITQNNAGQLIKDIRSVGYEGMFMGPDGIAEVAFIEAAGEAAEGVYTTFGGVPASELTGAAGEWRDSYKAKYGSDPEVYTVYGYVAATMLVDALNRVCTTGGDPTNREAVRAAVFATKDFDSVLGKFSIDANGDTSITTMSGNQVQGGELKFVTLLGGG